MGCWCPGPSKRLGHLVRLHVGSCHISHLRSSQRTKGLLRTNDDGGLGPLYYPDTPWDCRICRSVGVVGGVNVGTYGSPMECLGYMAVGSKSGGTQLDHRASPVPHESSTTRQPFPFRGHPTALPFQEGYRGSGMYDPCTYEHAHPFFKIPHVKRETTDRTQNQTTTSQPKITRGPTHPHAGDHTVIL